MLVLKLKEVNEETTKFSFKAERDGGNEFKLNSVTRLCTWFHRLCKSQFFPDDSFLMLVCGPCIQFVCVIEV